MQTWSFKQKVLFIVSCVLAIVPIMKAANYTNEYSRHLFTSLIDSTPIGTQTPSTGQFNWLSAGASSVGISLQGAYLEWNLSIGQGESDFVNLKGSGPGGFRWMNGNNGGTITELMGLDSAGNLSAASFNGPLNGNATSATTANSANTANSATTATNAGHASTADTLTGTLHQCSGGTNFATGIDNGGGANCANLPLIPGGVWASGSSTGGCTTANGSSFATCTITVPFTATPAFTDSNYDVTCDGLNPSGADNAGRAAQNGIITKNLSSVVVQFATMGSSAITMGSASCIIHHQ